MKSIVIGAAVAALGYAICTWPLCESAYAGSLPRVDCVTSAALPTPPPAQTASLSSGNFRAVCGAEEVPQPMARYNSKGMPTQAVHSRSANSSTGVHYFYNSVGRTAATTSISGDFTQGRPAVAAGDFHSLAELAAISADGKNIVEIGWTVDRSVDAEPHLFVYHWVDGAETCYDGCGYVQMSRTRFPGMTVPTTNVPQTYAIQYQNGNWFVGYQGEWIGYFPGSLWNDAFTEAGVAQWFGEVASSTSVPCSQMGTGIFGDRPGAASISSERAINTDTSDQFWIASDARWYTIEKNGDDSFNFGGPGACGNAISIGPGFTGTWYNPTESGHGFSIEVLRGNQMIASWYVFAPDGGQSWIVASGSITGNTATLQAFQPTGIGGRFPPNFNAAELKNQPWGKITFEFADCNNGQVSWQPTVAGYTSGSLTLMRLTMPAGLMCP